MRKGSLGGIVWIAVVAIAGCREREVEAPPPTAVPEVATPTAPVAIPVLPTPAPEVVEPPAPPTAAAREKEKEDKAAAGLQLLGVVRGASPSALIGHEGQQEIFRKGSKVYDRGTLQEVRADSVVIRSDSKDIVLRLEAAAEPVAPPAAEVVEAPPPRPDAAPPPVAQPLRRAEVREALQDFARVLREARARRVEAGGGYGVELVEVPPKGFLAKVGLKSGDVLQKIDKIAIEDPENPPALAGASAAQELRVTFLRNDIGLTISRPIE